MIRKWVEKPIAQELALCQRYYEKTFALDTAPVQAVGHLVGAITVMQSVAGASLQQLPSWQWQVPKRTAPTVTIYNPISANAFLRCINTASDYTTTTVSSISEAGLLPEGTSPAGSAIGNMGSFNATMNAEL